MLKSKLSLEEFDALPDEHGLEWVRGEVVEKPMPTVMHGVLAAMVAHFLLNWSVPRRAGQVMVEVRVRVNDSDDPRSLLPDVAFRSRQRIRGPLQHTPLAEAPDLAVEVLSPGQTLGGMLDRVAWFLGHGSRLVWVIDGEERAVAVFRTDKAAVVKRGADTLEDADVLPGFSLSVEELFASAEESVVDREEQP